VSPATVKRWRSGIVVPGRAVQNRITRLLCEAEMLHGGAPTDRKMTTVSLEMNVSMSERLRSV